MNISQMKGNRKHSVHLLSNVLGPALGFVVGGAHLLPLHGAVLLQRPPVMSQ